MVMQIIEVVQTPQLFVTAVSSDPRPICGRQFLVGLEVGAEAAVSYFSL